MQWLPRVLAACYFTMVLAAVASVALAGCAAHSQFVDAEFVIEEGAPNVLVLDPSQDDIAVGDLEAILQPALEDLHDSLGDWLCTPDGRELATEHLAEYLASHLEAER